MQYQVARLYTGKQLEAVSGRMEGSNLWLGRLPHYHDANLLTIQRGYDNSARGQEDRY